MTRREFIAGLGVAIMPAMRFLPARAQQVPVIGVLSSASFESMREFVAAFHQGLTEIGYVEGRTVVAEYRWAENDYDRLPALAADLVRRQVTVILRWGAPRPHLLPRPRPQRFQSSLRSVPTPFGSGSPRTLLDPLAILLAPPSSDPS
jgi:putative ABC transport system substrate-binding protein